MELISSNIHFVKCRGEQDIRRTPVVNQDPLHIEIGDGNRDDQCVVMGEMQASKVIIGESDGLLETILGVMPMVLVELTILIFVPFTGVDLDLPRPLYELLMFDLCEYLDYGSIKMRLLSFVIFSSSPFVLGLNQFFYGNVLVSFALEGRLGLKNTYGKGVE
ncbi:hypothetical protein Acr_17g0005580 [Actinidia rufa]|uniref:Uncharacterized protein n=1 Tax=Actinidia rufa TaxID=165716 RepID=A0A7J0G2G9_9ERIC|nr:hypothetical protein Acr_17g0005580 [Actinidia rufa]